MSVRRSASGRAHYNYFRDYEPAVGSYNESDPIGLKSGVNTFAYARGNPISLRDPLGLDPVYFDWGATGKLTGEIKPFDDGGGNLGVDIQLDFAPGSGCKDCPQIRTIQHVTENSSHKFGKPPLLDREDPNSGKPFYYSDRMWRIDPLGFGDTPRQPAPGHFKAELCFACVADDGTTIKRIFKCITYGFTTSKAGNIQMILPQAAPSQFYILRER